MKKAKAFCVFLFIFCFLAPAARAEESLSWIECVAEAKTNHPDLISAEENVKQSKAAKSITKSTLLPQVDANTDASRTKTTTTTAGVKTSKTADSYSYGANATQLLFDGFKTANDINTDSENIKAAQHNYRFTSGEVRLRLRNAFINLLKNQELLNITQDIYSIRRDNLELITLRYMSGMEHRGALLTAEANTSQAKLEIAQAQRALEVAQRQLVKEMGRLTFSPVQVKGEFKVKDQALQKPDFEKLAKNNPSLEKLTAQKNAASFGIKSAQADFFPKLSASASADKSSSRWPPKNSQLDAGLSVSLPLFEGGLRAAQVAQAKAVFNQARENERSAKDGIITTLEQAWATLRDGVEATDVQKQFLEATEERAKIAKAQYSLGLIQFDNWTIIEDDLVSAKKAFLNAQANALLDEAQWVQAKGETLEYAD